MSSAVVSTSAAGSPSAGTFGVAVASGAAAASELASAAAGASALSSPSAGGGVGGVAPPSMRSPAGRLDTGARRVHTAARGEGACRRGARAVRKAGKAMVPNCAQKGSRPRRWGAERERDEEGAVDVSNSSDVNDEARAAEVGSKRVTSRSSGVEDSGRGLQTSGTQPRRRVNDRRTFQMIDLSDSVRKH